MNNSKKLKSILIDEFIIGIFIISNLINLLADEQEKKYLYTKDKNILISANNKAIFTLSISIIIYLYFIYINYQEYIKHQYDYNSYIYLLRLIGSIIIAIGLSFLLYFRIINPEEEDQEIIEGL